MCKNAKGFNNFQYFDNLIFVASISEYHDEYVIEPRIYMCDNIIAALWQDQLPLIIRLSSKNNLE